MQLQSYPTRRSFLSDFGFGFGTLALAALLERDGLLAAGGSGSSGPGGTDLRARSGHFEASARSMIILNQVGGPSQMDLFDPKPELNKRDGEVYSTKFQSLQPGSESNKLMGSAFKFRPHGQCGMELSELVPHLSSVVDDLCLVRSMFSENNNHPQAMHFINTGQILAGRPTYGAWISYALGSENQNLPAYVALRDPRGYTDGGTTHWSSGWLPAQFAGTEFQSEGAAILNLHSGVPISQTGQRNSLRSIAALNRERQRLYPDESDLEARILNYELAARMQIGAEAQLDISGETAFTQQAYGLQDPTTENFGRRCLMARRLVESGVRVVQVMVPCAKKNGPWDHHNKLNQGIKYLCPQVDQPSAALIRDLKQRGLLDSTIVLWTGEFGRLPISQKGDGRDHNQHGFSSILAGGGFKAGHVHGATDEFGYRAVQDRVSCHDLHATILHLFGLDHARLRYLHHGRPETLTDPEVTDAVVVDQLLA